MRDRRMSTVIALVAVFALFFLLNSLALAEPIGRASQTNSFKSQGERPSQESNPEEGYPTDFTAKIAPSVAYKIQVEGPYATLKVIVQTRFMKEYDKHQVTSENYGTFKESFHNIDAFAAEFPACTIDDLANDWRVKKITPDYKMIPALDIAQPSLLEETIDYEKGGATIFDEGLTGKGVTIAVIDSGIYSHPDLMVNKDGESSPRIIYSRSFIDPGLLNYVENTEDPFGHGTHIAGIIAGSGFTTNQVEALQHFVGIAPEANLIALQVLGPDGSGYVSDVIAAIDWCIDNKNLYNIKIINMSLGHPVIDYYYNDPLCEAVEEAWKRNIVVVASAGNRGRDGYVTVNTPGNDPFILTVGAMNDINTVGRLDDIITTYSSRGPSAGDGILKPDIVSPGNKIISLPSPGSTLFKDYPENRVPPRDWQQKSTPADEQMLAEDQIFFELSGTSMATAFASATAALMLERDPSLIADTIKARIMRSADKLDYDLPTAGSGYLDPHGAVQETGICLDARSPRMCVDEFGDSYICSDGDLGGDGELWGDQALWGDQDLWGDQALWDDQTLWGDQALWGDQTLWGDQALWGDFIDIAVNGDE